MTPLLDTVRICQLHDHVIADSDLHVMEPPDLWQRYIAPEYRARRADRAHRAHAGTCGCG